MTDLSLELQKDFKAFAETTNDMIHINSADGQVLYANPATENILGYDLDTFVGSSPFDIIHPEDREKIQKDMISAQQGKQPTPQEIRLLKKDASYVDVEVRGFLFTDEDGQVKIGAILRDISLRKQREEELANYSKMLRHSEKLAAIGKLSACIAHEFNNPICGIQNVIEGIHKNASLDDDYKSLVAMALSECTRLKNLIANLQSYNRPSTEKKEPVDLNSLIDEIIPLVNTGFKKNHVGIQKEYSEDIPRLSLAPDQIKQVILNLLINAKDAVAGTGGFVSIRTEKDNQKLKMHFQDNGKGIAPDILDSIFDPFFTTKQESKGTGLGLSISDAIIRGHGGKITVSSKLGKGSTFTVMLPIS
jgi:PAS domain S-box-containing protein